MSGAREITVTVGLVSVAVAALAIYLLLQEQKNKAMKLKGQWVSQPNELIDVVGVGKEYVIQYQTRPWECHPVGDGTVRTCGYGPVMPEGRVIPGRADWKGRIEFVDPKGTSKRLMLEGDNQMRLIEATSEAGFTYRRTDASDNVLGFLEVPSS